MRDRVSHPIGNYCYGLHVVDYNPPPLLKAGFRQYNLPYGDTPIYKLLIYFNVLVEYMRRKEPALEEPTPSPLIYSTI